MDAEGEERRARIEAARAARNAALGLGPAWSPNDARLALWEVAARIERKAGGGPMTFPPDDADKLRDYAADQSLLDDPAKLGAALRALQMADELWPQVLRVVVARRA